MLTRRLFGTLAGSALVAPATLCAARKAPPRDTVLYSGVGRALTRYEVDIEAATLVRAESAQLQSNIQYAWPHPSHRFLYVSSSDSGPGKKGSAHFLETFRIEPGTGRLQSHGDPVRLRWRPIHNSVDQHGEYVLVAYNDPSGLSVHRIRPDGALGAEVEQPPGLDCGVFAHQVRATPANQTVILVTRGNDASASRPEDPGALKVFDFKDGQLANKTSVQPGDGRGFGPRHLDFHPHRPWVYVSVERENQLHGYELRGDGGLSPAPLFVTDTLEDPGRRVSVAGPIHVHPNGRFVYVANRGGWSAAPPPGAETYQGLPIIDSTDSSVAVFAIDGRNGVARLVQTAQVPGVHPRTFSLDPHGRLLIAGSLAPVALRKKGRIEVLPAGLSVFRISPEGRLEFVRRYDLETGPGMQWWTGMVRLAVS